MTKRDYLVSGLALAAAMAALPASAQDAPATTAPTATPVEQTATPAATPADDTPQQGGDIVVTASKRSEKLSDVPMSITAISGESLKEKGITSVADLVKVTPGLSYVESALSTPVYSLRGVGFYDTAIGARPTVSVYVDETPLPFSIMSQGAAFDLERVEILKGPQGTLFGSNSTGGAINYIAAKPKAELGAGGTISYARFNTVDAQAYVTGALAPNLNARLAVRSVVGDGWQRSITRDDTLGRQRFTQGRFLVDFTPTDRLRLSMNLNGYIDRGNTQAAQLIGFLYITPRLAGEVPLLTASPFPPANNRAADWDPGKSYSKNTRFYQAAFRGDYDVTDDITLTSLTAWSRILVDQNADVDGSAVESSDIGIVGKASSFSQELRLAGTMNAFRWIVGGNYSRDLTLENDYIHFPYASANHAFTPRFRYTETNPFTTQAFRSKAAFANADLDVGKLTFHGGLRYTKTDLDYSGCTKVNNDESGAAITTLFNILRGARGLSALPFLTKGQCQSLDATLTPNLRSESFDQDNLSWRTGVDYKPNNDVLLYANVSRGYKAGSVPAPGAINLEQFSPVTQESLLAYEAGFKYTLARRTVDLSGAAFYYDYTDKQLLAKRVTTPNLLGPLPALVNVPKSRVWGIEGQVSVYPIQGLSLTAAGTYLSTKVQSDFVNSTIVNTIENFKGDGFPYTPKWQVVLDGQYKFPLNDNLTAMIGGNLNYRSATQASFGVSPFLYIKGYTLVDARAGIEAPDGKWSLQLFGRNITDAYYWTNVDKFNDVVRRYSGMPATYGIQLSVRY